VIIANTVEELRKHLASWRREDQSIALVPTMGYFHEGHLSLMKRGAALADRVVVSLFVNPTQFGPTEDLGVYPSDFEGDCQKARNLGVDMLFCPAREKMYSPAHRTEVKVAGLTERLCGADRPVHFTGVATVVVKLFNIVRPDYACFGEKDFQQLRVIKQLVDDLNFEISIEGVPIVREPDGLAMSSRNAYLNDNEREAALVLYKALHMIREQVLQPGGVRHSSTLVEQARQFIESREECEVDYLEIVDELNLEAQPYVGEACRAVGAIRVNGRIRLIDNMALYL
jgi:pantoate--beta-alanine ligase